MKENETSLEKLTEELRDSQIGRALQVFKKLNELLASIKIQMKNSHNQHPDLAVTTLAYLWLAGSSMEENLRQIGLPDKAIQEAKKEGLSITSDPDIQLLLSNFTAVIGAFQIYLIQALTEHQVDRELVEKIQVAWRTLELGEQLTPGFFNYF